MDLHVAVDVTVNMSDYVVAFRGIAANGGNVASLLVNVTLGSTPCVSPVVEVIDALLANVTCRAPVRALQRDALTLAAEQKRRLWARPDGSDRQDWATRLREIRDGGSPGLVMTDRRVAARLPVSVAVSARGGRTIATTANATDFDQLSFDANADVVGQELIVWAPAPTVDLFNVTGMHRGVMKGGGLQVSARSIFPSAPLVADLEPLRTDVDLIHAHMSLEEAKYPDSSIGRTWQGQRFLEVPIGAELPIAVLSDVANVSFGGVTGSFHSDYRQAMDGSEFSVRLASAVDPEHPLLPLVDAGRLAMEAASGRASQQLQAIGAWNGRAVNIVAKPQVFVTLHSLEDRLHQLNAPGGGAMVGQQRIANVSGIPSGLTLYSPTEPSFQCGWPAGSGPDILQSLTSQSGGAEASAVRFGSAVECSGVAPLPLVSGSIDACGPRVSVSLRACSGAIFSPFPQAPARSSGA